jgi:hypothetical protein
MDEVPRIGDGALLGKIGPELTGQVELRIDFQRLRDVDAAIRPLRGVFSSQLAACPVPALFQEPELSNAQSDKTSKMEMESEGSSSLSKVPSVALIMPAPIRTTSVAASLIWALRSAVSRLRL